MSNIVTTDTATDQPAWQALADGCPNCGARPHDAPEGVNIQGDPHWDNVHCYKCGYRPGTNSVSDEQQMYEAFKRFMSSQPDYQHPTLNPPASGTEDDLRRQLADALAENARLRPGAESVTTPGEAFTPAGSPTIPDQPPSTVAGNYGAPPPMGEQGGQVPPSDAPTS